MMTLWDGHGFADDAYTNINSSSYHIYATYKLGLALMLANKLGISNTQTTNVMLQTISDCQIKDGTQAGGVRTDYTFNGAIVPSGSANTETTSIIAIATSATTQTSTPTPSPSPNVPELSWLIIVPLLLAIFCVIIVIRRRYFQ
jgi:hypothetical protein